MPTQWLSPYLIWFFIGVVFLLAEMATPGFILIFFAIGAWFCALLTFFLPVALTIQLVIFAATSLISLLFLRRFFIRTFKGSTDDQSDNGLSDISAGKIAKIIEPIHPPLPGQIKFRGSFWPAYCDAPVPEGASVTILGPAPHDNPGFLVEPIVEEEGK